jgi:hypothetical protein
MAKRKRLTPARVPAEDATEATAPLETKAQFPRYKDGVYRAPVRAPIADVAQDAAATAALSEVAQTLADARSEGRLIQALPLDVIEADYLVRDRIDVDADEMAVLLTSLRSRGQQTAIEVTALEDGRYGLISGWRRLRALREIQTEDPTRDRALAIVRTPENAAEAYLAMVEENEIRVGLSYYERARVVVRAVERGVYPTDQQALRALFHAASRPKRSKIGSFVRIVRALDAHLQFPTQLTERSGLALAQALDAEPEMRARIIAALTPAPSTAAAETAALANVLAAKPATAKPKADRKPQVPDLGTSAVSSEDIQMLPNGITLMKLDPETWVLRGPQLRDEMFQAKWAAWLKDA